MSRVELRLFATLFALGTLAPACGGVESEDGGADAGDELDSGAGDGQAGSGGTGGAGGTAGGAGQAGTGGLGGTGGALDASSCQSSYDLGHCILLTSPSETSTFVVPAFLGKINSDCRIKKLITKPAFHHANELTKFTLALWGCEGQSVYAFELSLGATKLSAADAALLIDYYTDLNVDALTLGPKAEQEMRDALACLAEKAITNPSTTDHEHSACMPDAGTDGGSDAPSEASEDAPADDASSADAGAEDGSDDAETPDAGAPDAEGDVLEGGTD